MDRKVNFTILCQGLSNYTITMNTASLISPNTACALIAVVNLIKHVINTPETINIPIINITNLFTNKPTISRMFKDSQELIEEVAINSRYSLDSEMELRDKLRVLE